MVITISRQYGSGGRIIGQMVAKKLGIPYYDNELITLAAQESGFDKKMFEEADKNASNSLLFSLSVYGGQGMGAGVQTLADKVFLIQSDVIKQVAGKGDCVIVGRCADYALKNSANCISIFLRAPLEDRIKRAMKEYNDDEATVSKKVSSTDKKRSVYYAHFTGEKWGVSENYDMVINTSTLGIEKTADLICEAYKKGTAK